MSNKDRPILLPPAGAQSVNIRAVQTSAQIRYEDGDRSHDSPTNATVSDLNIDICVFKLLWLVALPLHVSLSGVGIQAQPALEFVIVGHREVC